jgi:uncharacterized protein YcbK (DUF882 family)
MHTRRSVLAFAAAAAFAPRAAGADEVRALRFHNLHTGETLDAPYWRAGAYAPDVLDAVNAILRDHRTGEIHAIDTGLLDLLHGVAARLEARPAFHVISGYRSPQTNAALADASAGVARRSLHMRGMAIDVTLEGVGLERLRDAGVAFAGGGVGYYPDPGFVHLDVGRVRRW